MKHGKAMVLVLVGALLFLMVAVLPFWLLAGDMEDGYRGETPFGHVYYAPELKAQVRLGVSRELDLMPDGTADWQRLGKLESVQDSQGVWTVDAWQLTAQEGGSCLLSGPEGETELYLVDTMTASVRDDVGLGGGTLVWTPAYAPELGTSATLHGAGSITFSFRQEQPQTLRVLENDQERLLPLEEGKGYVIALPNQTGNITYRIPYRDGEYILHITCQGK